MNLAAVVSLAASSLLIANSFSCPAAPGDERWDFRFGRPGLSGAGAAAAWFQGQWYVGGLFDAAGHFKADNITRWDGQEWQPVGEGLQTDAPYPPFPFPVTALAVWNGALYAGGSLTRSGSRELAGLARWDGTRWSALSGVSGSVSQLAGTSHALFLAGRLQRPGDTNAYAVAKWDGAAWDFLDSRMDAWGATAGALAVREPAVYISGAFETVAGQPIANNAFWDGAEWKALPGLTNQEFFALAIFQGDLFASGTFTEIGGIAATNIARWDGTNWQAAGSGLDGVAQTLLSDGTALYAAGDFAHAGAEPADGVARWDGLNWRSVGVGAWPDNSRPFDLGLGGPGNLVAVGSFASVNGAAAGGVALWDGARWASRTTICTQGAVSPMPAEFPRSN
jgi:trimeric autotransporter adhesin